MHLCGPVRRFQAVYTRRRRRLSVCKVWWFWGPSPVWGKILRLSPGSRDEIPHRLFHVVHHQFGCYPHNFPFQRHHWHPNHQISSPPFLVWQLPKAVTPGSRTKTVVDAIILCSSSSLAPEPEEATDLSTLLCYYQSSSIVIHQRGLSKDLESVWGSLTQRVSAQSATAQTRISHCKKV